MKKLITKATSTPRYWLSELYSEHIQLRLITPQLHTLPMLIDFIIYHRILRWSGDSYIFGDTRFENFIDYVLFNFSEGAFDKTELGQHYLHMMGLKK